MTQTAHIAVTVERNRPVRIGLLECSLCGPLSVVRINGTDDPVLQVLASSHKGVVHGIGTPV